jgi:hypothetical protein
MEVACLADMTKAPNARPEVGDEFAPIPAPIRFGTIFLQRPRKPEQHDNGRGEAHDPSRIELPLRETGAKS